MGEFRPVALDERIKQRCTTTIDKVTLKRIVRKQIIPRWIATSWRQSNLTALHMAAAVNRKDVLPGGEDHGHLLVIGWVEMAAGLLTGLVCFPSGNVLLSWSPSALKLLI